MTIPMFAAQETDNEIRRIAAAMHWTLPRSVFTRYGPRMVREALINNGAFWKYYRHDPTSLQRLSMQLSQEDGVWKLIHWMPISSSGKATKRRSAADLAAELSIRREKVESSTRTNSDFNVPSPPGCAYLPYQNAAIQLAFQRKAGTLIADDMGLGALHIKSSARQLLRSPPAHP